MRADRREVARYLGIRSGVLTADVEEYAAACEAELEGSVVPKTVRWRMACNGLPGESRDLSRHLRHCKECVVYAATLGAETDRLLRRWAAQSMAKAAVGQAVCAVWLDDLCAGICGEISAELAPGYYLTPPFSPGYGDWDLSVQRQMLGLLNAHKRIGLTLTQGGMLVPEKSVTAVVGISDRKEESCGQKCMRCEKKDCPFRAAL